MADRARRDRRSAARRSAKPKCLPRPASPTSGCRIRCNPVERAAVLARLMDVAHQSRSSSITKRSRARGRRRCARRTARSTCSSRWTSGFTAAASIRPTAAPPAFVRRVAGLRGLRLLGLLSHAGHVLSRVIAGRAPCDSAAPKPRTLGSCATLARHGRDRLDEISVGRDADARFSAAARRDRDPPGQLRLLRPDAGGAPGGDAGRLRAHRPRHGRVAACPRPRHPRLRQQDADSDQARGFGPAPGYGVVCGTSSPASRRHADHRAPVGGACDGPGRRGRPRAGAGRPRTRAPNHSCVVSNLVDRVW